MNRQTPPDRRASPGGSDDYNAARREEERRRRAAEHAREVKKARVELAIIGAAIVAGIVILVLIVCAIARSGKENEPAQTEAPLAAVTEAQTETAPPESAAQTQSDPGVNENARTLKNEIESDYAIMIDLSTHEAIMTKKGDERIYPASMTKMMTLIVACEHTDSLEDTVEMTAEILGPLWQENATVAGFSPGEKARLDDLMYGLILPSGADCAVALAQHIAGSEEAFAELMNEKVAELGLKGTHFVNPTGLHDPEQYSTCRDIARILEYAISDPFMKQVLTTFHYTTHPTAEHPDGIYLESTMQQEMRGDETPGIYICGGKTGYTDEARRCLASFAVRTDREAPLSEAEMDAERQKNPEYIFVSAHGATRWTPIFDALNAYALVVDENALETKQVSQR